ncbi:MAG TPA: adenylate/guanylate cyclase domain-containing protein, partial [Candidatus Limnocylindrales bacterium]|nr:adenylate/guanylate cyclase domain-containing protein [Candidatus Limnocylindrales bacterium]
MSLADPAGPDATAEALHARISAATPAPLVDKMRSAKLTGERKPVTALFADVVGSTTLAERMDPEDWTQMMNEAFDLMSKAIFRYEGTIAQLQGDALVAFFGAPVAHEDDPERAVLAALEMVAQTDEFARQLKQSHGIDFRIRAGINTGPVIVGNVGSDLRYEYTALGDAVNVAARVQTAAEPGTVLITDQTHHLVGNTFDVVDLGPVEVKGKAEPIHLFKVLGSRSDPGRKRGLESVGLSSDLVGREAELRTLRELFDVTRAGRGRLALLLGEPGLGKSRLLAELHSTTGELSPAATWIEGRCVSYGRTLPYHLVFDLVRSMLGLPQLGADLVPRSALDERLTELLGDEAQDSAVYFAHLLGMPLSIDETERVQVDPDALQGRYVAALHRTLRAISERGPVVLVFEDIHWADPASVEVVIQLLSLVSTLPVLTIFSGRGETDVPGFRLIAHPRSLFGDALSEIRLQPL